MNRALSKFSVFILCWALVADAACFGQDQKTTAADAQSGDAESPPAKPPHHKVAKGPFKISLGLEGVFEAEESAELSLSPQEWPQFVVLRAVEQGMHVKKGDTLVWLDTRKIDEQIRDLQAARELTSIAIRQAEEQVRHLEKSVPLDLAAAERAKKIADEDLTRFLKTDRDLEQQQAEYELRSSAQWLEYSQEELNQLQKMYEADDLTEETEEIILKRARNDVEMAQFYFDVQKIMTDRTLNVVLPRREVMLTTDAERQAVAWTNAQKGLPLSLEQQREQLKKLKLDRQIADERLEKLKADRKAMDVRATAEGVVYYGQSLDGKWDTASAAGQMLQPGGQLAPHKVFITIVQTKPLNIRAVVPEKNLHFTRVGMPAKIVPAGYPELKLTGEVVEVSQIPDSDGKFRAKIKLTGKPAERLVPRMTCTVKLVPYVKKDALAVPAKSVFEDELDEEQKYVYVVTSDGQHQRREVTTGKTTDDKVEIVGGLKEGDKILLKKPDGDTSN